MACFGMTLVLGIKSDDPWEEAIKEIKEFSKNNKIIFMKLDLSSFDNQSIRSFVKEFKKLNKPLDILINNAGIFAPPYQKSIDGFELQLATNHLGPFLLTNLLLPCLERSNRPRIVIVSSIAHYGAKLDFEHLSCESEKDFYPMYGYQCSKLCNVLFTFQLQKLLDEKGSKIVVNTIHPGILNTNIWRNYRAFPLIKYIFSTRLISYFITKVEDGANAVSTLALGIDENVENIKGGYFDIKNQKSPSTFASDKKNWKKLWDVSCDLTGIELNL
eukprot:gene8455-10386_t